MTKLTTKQFRAIVREEAAKIPGCSIQRSYTDTRKGPTSDLCSCAFYIYAKGNHNAHLPGCTCSCCSIRFR